MMCVCMLSQSVDDHSMEEPGPKKQCTAQNDVAVSALLMPTDSLAKTTPTLQAEPPSSSMDTMTSKDYYFDSYSHFGKYVLMTLYLGQAGM